MMHVSQNRYQYIVSQKIANGGIKVSILKINYVQNLIPVLKIKQAQNPIPGVSRYHLWKLIK